MNAHDIIIKPVLTEKSYEAIQNKTYVFIVAKKAGKTEIKQAVETIFDGVKVESVNTINRLGKVKRQGRTEGLHLPESGFVPADVPFLFCSVLRLCPL